MTQSEGSEPSQRPAEELSGGLTFRAIVERGRVLLREPLGGARANPDGGPAQSAAEHPDLRSSSPERDGLLLSPDASPEKGALPERVRAVAEHLRDAHDLGRLRDLADALSGGPSAAAWRSLSPLEAFDEDALAHQLVDVRGEPRWVWWLETLRNGLIFVPVAITWWGISNAVDTYRRLLADLPDSAALPFLYLWESGFEGRLDGLILGLTLSQLAAIDSIVVGILVMLTVAREWVVGGWEQRFQEKRQEVTTLLSDAALALATALPLGTLDTIQRLDEVGRALLSDLREDRARLRDATDLQTQQTAELRELTLHLTNAAANLSVVVQALVEVTPRIDGYLQTIAHAQADHALTQSGLKDTVQALHTTVTGLLTRQESLLQAAVGPLTDAASTSALSAAQLRDLVTTVIGRQQELLDALDSEREGQERLYRAFTNALVEFEQALTEAATYSRTMYGITVDVRDLANALPALVRSIDLQMRGAAHAQVVAAEALMQAAVQLEQRDQTGPNSLDGPTAPRGAGEASAP